jgi:DNA-binding transcriptional ArsR family regulator
MPLTRVSRKADVVDVLGQESRATLMWHLSDLGVRDVTSREAARITGLSMSAVINHLNALRDAGFLLRFKGGTGPYRWTLAVPGDPRAEGREWPISRSQSFQVYASPLAADAIARRIQHAVALLVAPYNAHRLSTPACFLAPRDQPVPFDLSLEIRPRFPERVIDRAT